MSKRTVYHVTKSDNWNIKKEGADRASATATTKQNAIDRAVELAKGSGGLAQVKIHNENGKISSERTYGEDPRKYPS